MPHFVLFFLIFLTCAFFQAGLHLWTLHYRPHLGLLWRYGMGTIGMLLAPMLLMLYWERYETVLLFLAAITGSGVTVITAYKYHDWNVEAQDKLDELERAQLDVTPNQEG